jgi:hypothetical protein
MNEFHDTSSWVLAVAGIGILIGGVMLAALGFAMLDTLLHRLTQ